MINPEAPSTAPVAWCRSDDFSAALQKVQSFSGWREPHPDCDMALYAQPQASPPVAAAQPEGPSLADVDELCAEFGFDCNDDSESLSILLDMITAAITRWRAPVALFGDSLEPDDPYLEEVVGYVMGGHEIDEKRIRLTIAVLEPCPETEWRPIARKALKRLTAPPVAQPAAQPVNLAEPHDPDFSGGLTPSQRLDVVHGGADPTWRPIETAPRDGTWVLLAGGECESNEESDNRGRVVTAQWTTEYRSNAGDRRIDDFGRWEFAYYDSGFYGEYENPTYWQPLPSPPTPLTPMIDANTPAFQQ